MLFSIRFSTMSSVFSGITLVILWDRWKFVGEGSVRGSGFRRGYVIDLGVR